MSCQLHDIRIGESALILAVDLGEKERLRLESMGILPGVEVSILAKGTGPIIVVAGDSRVMIEHEIASKIIVI